MANKYNSVLRLIELWQVYEEEHDAPQLCNFASWMTEKLQSEPDLNVVSAPKRAKIDEPANAVLFQQMDESARFLEYLSRIARLHDFYIKKFFGELQINNRLDYLFLYTLRVKQSAKKSELINLHLVDYTTGMDIIKRLIANGLLSESPDETDKRAKILSVTPAGLSVLEQSERKLAEETKVFLACINTNKWKKSLSLLEEINKFHSGIFMAHNDKTPAELSNLMDSLKRLHR
jgi:DNA-binding MarR family transcriptional regulator